jgi:hypothetical protein
VSQHHHLLAQEDLLEHQFRLGSSWVYGCIQDQGMAVRLGPRTEMSFDSLGESVLASE